jgi:hypothetical protein
MFYNSWLKSVVVPLTALVVALTLTCQQAEAQVKPFKVKGEGESGPEGLSVIGAPSPYGATGTATHLGNYSGSGFAQVTGPGTFTGAFDFVAANGDVLSCVHPGTFAVYPDGQGRFFAIFDAIFTPTSASTGKFANVGGSFRMIAITESFDVLPTGSTTPFDFEWHGEGSLEFAKKK